MTTDTTPTARPKLPPPPEPPAPPAVRRRRRPKILTHIALIGFGLFMLYPLIWLFISSFKPTSDIFSEPGLVPKDPTLRNYPDGWTALTDQFGHYMLNSLI